VGQVARGIIDMLIEEAPEHRVNRWRKLYPKLLKEFPAAMEADPTTDKKYTQWILARLSDNSVRLPEDTEKVKTALEQFARLSRLPQFQGARNVFELKTYADLVDVIEKNAKAVSKGEEIRIAVREGVDKIYDDGTYEIYMISNPKAAHEFLYPISSVVRPVDGHHWCVKDESYATRYMRDSNPDGKLYCIMKSGKPWMMVSKAGKAADRQDRPSSGADQNELFKLDVPDRIKLYAMQISSLKERSDFIEKMIISSQDASMASEYARHVNHGTPKRFPEFEPFILKDPIAAVGYAMAAVGGRWAEAEPVIMQSQEAIFKYAVDVIKGRWKEAEQLFMTRSKAKK